MFIADSLLTPSLSLFSGHSYVSSVVYSNLARGGVMDKRGGGKMLI